MDVISVDPEQLRALSASVASGADQVGALAAQAAGLWVDPGAPAGRAADCIADTSARWYAAGTGLYDLAAGLLQRAVNFEENRAGVGMTGVLGCCVAAGSTAAGIAAAVGTSAIGGAVYGTSAIGGAAYGTAATTAVPLTAVGAAAGALTADGGGAAVDVAGAVPDTTTWLAGVSGDGAGTATDGSLTDNWMGDMAAQGEAADNSGYFTAADAVLPSDLNPGGSMAAVSPAINNRIALGLNDGAAILSGTMLDNPVGPVTSDGIGVVLGPIDAVDPEGTLGTLGGAFGAGTTGSLSG